MQNRPSKPTLRMPRRAFLKLSSVSALVAIIAASTRNIAGAQTPSIKNVKANLSTIRLGEFNPNYATQWTYRLAQALGYMEDHGIEELDVILSDEYMPGLIGGSLDITHGDTSEFFGSGNASGLPIKLISLHRDKEWWVMGAGSHIKSPEDLKGKKISGGGLSGRNTWVMQQVVKKIGLDPENDVEFVPSSGGSDARMAGVINGTLDAASMFPRHRAGLEEAGGSFLFEELVTAPQEGFAAMGDWLEENEDTAYAFVLADLKARQWLFDPANKERAYQIMIDYGYEIPDSFKALYSVELDQLSTDGGFASSDAMDEFCNDLSQTGALPENLDWRQFVELKYLWAAQDALGIERRPASL